MKGISELVAAILVIAIAIVVGTIIAMWNIGFIREERASISCGSDTSYIIESARLGIVKPYTLTLKVTNHGKLPVWGFGVILRNATSSIQLSSDSPLIDQAGITKDEPLGPGQSVYINIDLSSYKDLANSLQEVILTNDACWIINARTQTIS